MPVSLNTSGGDGWKNRIAQSKDQALQDLQSIQVHLSQRGNQSGVLTLVNRTRQDAPLTLKRKAFYQLWGKGSESRRLNDTKFVLTSLLQKAGLRGAEDDLNTYLSAERRHGNRISARQMLALLNKHLPAQRDTVDADGGQVQGAAQPGSQLVMDRVDTEDTEFVWNELQMKESDSSAVGLAAHGAPNPQPAQAQPLAVRYPGADLYPPKAEAASLDALLTTAQVRNAPADDGGDGILGQGAFGIARLVTMGQQPGKLVLKTFLPKHQVSVSADRSGNPNEGVAAYLTSKKAPEYAASVNVIQPAYFLINAQGRFLMMPPLALRAMAKGDTSKNIKCVGLVMERSDGAEVTKLESQLSGKQRKQILQGTLQSIRLLNQRGFTHRDIKPDNTFFDPATGKVTLIDTGMLHKTSKSLPATRQITGFAGSPLYMHPRAMTGKPYGTEADLYSASMMALELHAPRVVDLIGEAFVKPVIIQVKNHMKVEPRDRHFDRNELIGALDLRIRQIGQKPVKAPSDNDETKALEAFKSELADPGSYGSYLLDCLQAATATNRRMVRSVRGQRVANPVPNQAPIDWRNPAEAQATYERLLNDPRLNAGL